MFYGSNTRSYTMLGHVEDLTNWNEALEGEEITAFFFLFQRIVLYAKSMHFPLKNPQNLNIFDK